MTLIVCILMETALTIWLAVTDQRREWMLEERKRNKRQGVT